MKKYNVQIIPALLLVFYSLTALADLPVVRVASKTFNESYILAEIISQVIEDSGFAKVERKHGLGGSGVTFTALEQGEIDIYPEYTGTISEALLKNPDLKKHKDILFGLEEYGLIMSSPLGFNNTYALVVHPDTAKDKGLRKISDLSKYANIKTAFNHEFLKRKDGAGKLQEFYSFKLTDVRGMNHSLSYEAINKKKIEMMEAYSTDAKISEYKLVLLEDDKEFFPEYKAVLLASKSFAQKMPKVWALLQERLAGKINQSLMAKLNAEVAIKGKTVKQVASQFLGKEARSHSREVYSKIFKLTIDHIKLVFIGLLFAVIIGIPFGILATRNRLFGNVILNMTGILQTIPSLALLCFLIPIFGIGKSPAYVALFLYGLLPIVRGTYSGIKTVDKKSVECAEMVGMSFWQLLFYIKLPLSSVQIMSGIKTSAVINVGTATLAAFVGAGGLGSLIVTGLSLNDNEIILQGAIPAAILAVLIHILFEFADRLFIPRPLRAKKL